MSNWSEQKREERALFQAFLDTCPGFADEEIVEWSPVQGDPPDVLCLTASARRVGVEICQWAHLEEMKAGKRREKIERQLLEAIGTPQPINTSKNFWRVVFFPKPKVPIGQLDPTFREGLLQLIEHVDQTWPSKLNGMHYRFRDVQRFPPVDKYLELIVFSSGGAMTPGVDWIGPASPVDTFNDRTMVEPLLKLLEQKAFQLPRP